MAFRKNVGCKMNLEKCKRTFNFFVLVKEKNNCYALGVDKL